MIQKTVQFYEEYSNDVKALTLLNDYRKYGFNSCREMIIAAINMFEQGRYTSSVMSSNEIEELAEEIARRINVTTVASSSVVEKKEENYNDNNNSEDNFAKAMDFINSL
ncbi:MAG TPA: hypothetical protein PLZ77_00755 [Lachnospiraceae bacterium]|nr:hypothetical protein [Lachnospiraceae bacterium]